MILTVSASNTFQECATLWSYSHLANRVPAIDPVPFTGGKLWHSFIEGVLQGEDRAVLKDTLRARAEVAAHELDAAGRFKKATELRNTWTVFEQVGDFWRDRFEGPTVAVEQAITAPLGTLPNGELVQIAGIPDRVRRINGRLVHTQTRTLNVSTPMAPYLKAFGRNMHELVYSWLIQQAYPGEPYFGSELQVLRKAKLWSDRKCSKAGTKWHATKERPDCEECHYEDRVRTELHKPEELLIQELVPIDEAHVKLALEDVMGIAFGMQRVREGERPLQNRGACLGKFGNSLCAYYDICNGTASLTDPEFKDRDSRYAEAQELEEVVEAE